MVRVFFYDLYWLNEKSEDFIDFRNQMDIKISGNHDFLQEIMIYCIPESHKLWSSAAAHLGDPVLPVLVCPHSERRLVSCLTLPVYSCVHSCQAFFIIKL